MSYEADFEFIKQNGDGTCLFHSVAYHIHGRDNQGAPIRAAVIEWYRTPAGQDFLDDRSAFLLITNSNSAEALSIDAYIDHMSLPKSYAALVEISAIETMIATGQMPRLPPATSIFFYHNGSKNYRDSGGNIVPVSTVKMGSNICLIFNGTDHYDALKKKEEEEEEEDQAGGENNEEDDQGQGDEDESEAQNAEEQEDQQVDKDPPSSADNKDEPQNAEPGKKVKNGVLPCQSGDKPVKKSEKEEFVPLSVELTCQHGRECKIPNTEIHIVLNQDDIADLEEKEEPRYKEKVNIKVIDNNGRITEIGASSVKEPIPLEGDKCEIELELKKRPIPKPLNSSSIAAHLLKPFKDIQQVYTAMKAVFKDKSHTQITNLGRRVKVTMHNPDRWEISVIGNFLPEPSQIGFGYQYDQVRGEGDDAIGGYSGSADSGFSKGYIKIDRNAKWKTNAAGHVLGHKGWDDPAFAPGSAQSQRIESVFQSEKVNQITKDVTSAIGLPREWVQFHRNGKQVQIPVLSTLNKLYNTINGIYTLVNLIREWSPNYWYVTGSMRVLNGCIGVGWQNVEIPNSELAATDINMFYKVELFYAKLEAGVGPDIVAFKAQICASIEGKLEIDANLGLRVAYHGVAPSLYANYEGEILGTIWARVEVIFFLKLEPKIETGLVFPGYVGIKGGEFSISGEVVFKGVAATYEFSVGLHLAVKRLVSEQPTEADEIDLLKKKLVTTFEKKHDNRIILFVKGATKRFTNAAHKQGVQEEILLEKELTIREALISGLKKTKIKLSKFNLVDAEKEYLPHDVLSDDVAVDQLMLPFKNSTMPSMDTYLPLETAERTARGIIGLLTGSGRTVQAKISGKKFIHIPRDFYETDEFKKPATTEYEKIVYRAKETYSYEEAADRFVKELLAYKEGKFYEQLQRKNCLEIAQSIVKDFTQNTMVSDKSMSMLKGISKIRGGGAEAVPHWIVDLDAYMTKDTRITIYEKYKLDEKEKSTFSKEVTRDSGYSYFGHKTTSKKSSYKVWGKTVGVEYEKEWTIVPMRKLSIYQWPSSGDDTNDGDWDGDLGDFREAFTKKFSAKQSGIDFYDRWPTIDEMQQKEVYQHLTSLEEALKKMMFGERFETTSKGVTKNGSGRHIRFSRSIKSRAVLDELEVDVSIGIFLYAFDEGAEHGRLHPRTYMEIITEFRQYIKDMAKSTEFADGWMILDARRYWITTTNAEMHSRELLEIYTRKKAEAERRPKSDPSRPPIITVAQAAAKVVDKLREVESAWVEGQGDSALRVLRSEYEYAVINKHILHEIDLYSLLRRVKNYDDSGTLRLVSITDLVAKLDASFFLRHTGYDIEKLEKVMLKMLNNSKGDPEPGGNWRKRYFVQYVLRDDLHRKFEQKIFAKMLIEPLGKLTAQPGFRLKASYEAFEGMAHAIRHEILEEIRYSGQKDEEETSKEGAFGRKKRLTVYVDNQKFMTSEIRTKLEDLYKRHLDSYWKFINELEQKIKDQT